MTVFAGTMYLKDSDQERYDCGRAEQQARADAIALATLGPAARLRRIVETSGPDCTLLEAQRHLAEDGLTCTEQEFAAVHRTLFPPADDWKRPINRKEKTLSKPCSCDADDVPATISATVSDAAPGECNFTTATSKQIRALLTELGPDIGYEAFADLLAARGYFCSSDSFYRQRCNLGFARPGSRKKIGQSSGKRLMQSTGSELRKKPAAAKSPLDGLHDEVRRHIGQIDRMIAELQGERANLARYLGGAKS